MQRGTPFHSRTSRLCESYAWQPWSGFVSVTSYTTVPEMEYHAIRHSAGLMDVSPLKKYRISGKDAGRLVQKAVTRDVSKLGKGHIAYTCWCDEEGKTVDDGTLWNLGDNVYRMTAATPNLKWLQDVGAGLEADVEDVSDDVAVAALQGPLSKAILNEATDGAVEKLKWFRFTPAKLDGLPVTVSRTGFTGDLGYEVWVEPAEAGRAWDSIMTHGESHDAVAVGMHALEVSRIEAGFVLAEHDYTPSRDAIIESQKFSPYELSLDWTVNLEKGPFVGRRALVEEARRGPARRFVGLEVDWKEAEKLYRAFGLPPEPPHEPWDTYVPIYAGTRQIGRGTSGVWSPILKKFIVMGFVDAAHSALGTVVRIELTIEGEHRLAPARVVKRPFFDPERKRA